MYWLLYKIISSRALPLRKFRCASHHVADLTAAHAPASVRSLLHRPALPVTSFTYRPLYYSFVTYLRDAIAQQAVGDIPTINPPTSLPASPIPALGRFPADLVTFHINQASLRTTRLSRLPSLPPSCCPRQGQRVSERSAPCPPPPPLLRTTCLVTTPCSVPRTLYPLHRHEIHTTHIPHHRHGD